MKKQAFFAAFVFMFSFGTLKAEENGRCTVLDRLQVIGSGFSQNKDISSFSLFDQESLKKAQSLGRCLMVSSSAAFNNKYLLKYVSNGNVYVLLGGEVKEFMPSLKTLGPNGHQQTL